MNPITGLICILGVLPGFLSQTIHVWQTPVIWATEGSSVTLPCDYRIIGEMDTSTGSYKWYRHMVRSKVEVTENNMKFSGRLSSVVNDQFIRGRSAAITLQRLELSDSGMYYCEVIFENGQKISGEGNGTFLNVTASVSGPPPYTVQNIIRMVLGVLVVLAALSVCCFSGDKKNENQRESKQCEVRLNMTFSQPNAPPSEEKMV
ncbi:natural cytotoxicity triggering receptor 3-like [Lithobates pipiens]